MNVAAKRSVYEPDQAGLAFPRYPVFDDAAHERRHRKIRLAAACRLFADLGYEYGFAGHITVRDPEDPNLYWTNPFALEFGAVKASDLLLVDHDGRVIEGTRAVNRAGFVLHAAIHAAHPGILASCHCHTINGMAGASTRSPRRPAASTATGRP
jgi:ribulose-5-phosphate 4-epimerase/fuculose-1-phosphate aldolase